ncbi:hypothetical protein E1A90_25080 [Bacillus mycoides]|nr:hypothetical protein E1A90_25080 [Bacillus mycoides]
MGTYRQSSYFKRASWSIIYEKSFALCAQSFFFWFYQALTGSKPPTSKFGCKAKKLGRRLTARKSLHFIYYLNARTTINFPV